MWMKFARKPKIIEHTTGVTAYLNVKHTMGGLFKFVQVTPKKHIPFRSKE